MSFNKRLIIIIIVVIGVVYFLRGGLFKSTSNQSSSSPSISTEQIPTANVDISNWKVYKSPNADYQVSYPSNWKEQDSEGRLVVSSKYSSNADISFSVRVERRTSNNFSKIIDQFNRLYNQSNGFSDSGKVKLQNMMIGGYPSIKLLQLPETGSSEITSLNYEVKVDDEAYYYLSFTPFNDETWTKNSALITYIVESFKITLPTNSTLTPTNPDLKN